jgi:ABC-2 type transport system permease protein
MGFKSNFLLWIVVETLWFALQICFIAVIYQHTDLIGDWTKWQVVLLIGTSQFIQQIFQSLFLSNIVQISELVRTGKLDFMLLLPVNTRFLVSLRQVDLGGFFNACSALAVIGYSLHQLGVAPSPGQAAGFVLLVAAGVVIHYSFMFMLSCVSFWTVKAGGVVWGYYSLFNIARLPDVVFRGFFKALFTFAVPMLLVANVPARLVMGKLVNFWPAGLALVMALAALGLSGAMWKFSVRRYASASS